MEPQYPKCSLSDESLEGQIETSDMWSEGAQRGLGRGAEERKPGLVTSPIPSLGVGPHSEGVEGSQSPSP